MIHERLHVNQDFPSDLRVIDANMLYVTKSGVSQRALNRIKRLAAFQNPKYYQAQRMRMSTHNIPRIICSLDETPEYLGIPRGCRTALVELLDQAGVKYAFADKKCAGRPINVSFAGALRDEQQLAADALLAHETGVLSATTAFGKTVIGSALIAKRKCNALILVHMQTLMNQWKSSLEQFLSINEPLPEIPGGRGRKKSRSIIGQIGSGKNALSGIVDVASIQSLVHGDEVSDIVKNYGMVIQGQQHLLLYLLLR